MAECGLRWFLAQALLLALTTQPLWAADADKTSAPETPARRVDFQADVAPILERNCIECHGGLLRMAGLRLDERRLAFEGGDSGSPIKAGNSKESLLVQRLTDKDLGIVMPPSFPFFPGEKPGLRPKQIETLKLWIDQGAEWPDTVSLAMPSDSTSGGEKANNLFAAIRAGKREAVSAMLEDAALAGVVDGRGSTPLMHAALLADAQMVRLLVERGADVNAANSQGLTALMLAAGDADKVRLLLAKGAKADARSLVGRTPLLIAATYANNIDVVRQLVQGGASITSQDVLRETVLTSASKRGDAQLVQMLIEAGADVYAGGRPPLAWAAEEGNAATIACLLEHGAGKNRDNLNAALVVATMRGPVDPVRVLLEHGADPNACCPMGPFGRLTPLMGAAYSASSSPEVINLLLEKGADAKAKAPSGTTALRLARQSGDAKVIELLEKTGATE
jgi:ankyrin repeat protein